MKNLPPMIQCLEKNGTHICNQVYAYSKKGNNQQIYRNSGTVISHASKKISSKCNNERRKNRIC
jgi:hypothetical protein